MTISLLVCTLAMTPFANADVVTFNDLEGDLESNTYTESGYTFTALANGYGDAGVFYAVTAADVEYGYYYESSAALVNDLSTRTLLTASAATPFNLHSIDIAELFSSEEPDDSVDAVTIILNAIFNDGTMDSYEFTTDGFEGFETWILDLEDVAVVSFVGLNNDYFQFDNVYINEYHANAVPVPSSILLLLAGMGALAGTTRKVA